MKVSEVLTNAALNRLKLPADLSQLPDAAYQEFEEGGKVFAAHEVMQNHVYLPPAYQQLAWRCADNIRTEMGEVTFGSASRIPDRFLEPTSASMAGISVMTKYLSFLPYVYGEQRQEFAGKPATLAEQVQDLGDIAVRSTRHITTIAEQAMPISGKLEEHSMLRDDEKLRTGPMLVRANNQLKMTQSEAGPLIASRFNLDNQIAKATGRFEEANPDEKLRKVGCMMLHFEMELGVTLFDGFWNQLVDAAVTDERFFAADLTAIDEYEASRL